jgi:assimilatory nitrate reductase catalytic subunit
MASASSKRITLACAVILGWGLGVSSAVAGEPNLPLSGLTFADAEGRVVRIRKAVDPPGNARSDTNILLEIAKRLGAEKHFAYNSSEEIFNELRVASKGGTADYFGITYKKIEDNMGVFWPCPSEDHPGTPRLWEDYKFKTPDGRAHFHGVPYREPAETTDPEYPMILTTGRVVSQYLSVKQRQLL